MKPYLSVIVPAYNEEKRIRKTLDIIYNYLIQKTFTWEILIVLDGPTDGTIDVIKKFAEGKQHIRWIDRKENHGKGYTVREGMLAAWGDIRLFTDADNSTDIAHFDKMKPLFDDGYPVVICSRDEKDAPGATQAVPQPFFKRLLGNAGNLFIQVMAVPGIWDTQCGFKAFTAPAAQQIFSIAVNNSWVFDIEALALARRFGYKIGLVAAHWVDDAETHVKLLNYIGSLLQTFQIRWDLMTGKYDRSAKQIEAEKAVPLKR
ncbi:MAG: glycosyltransferase family 2 protein [Chloroflexi bacterium]|nr:MAG: glycosyltransferase family 2 protein [Chloroflexota bacterium]